MRRHIKDMINDMGIVVLYGPLEAKGMYVDDYRAIILDNNLSEEEEEMVLLHELGHAARQSGEMNLYHRTRTMQAKAEAEAEKFMVAEEVETYLIENDLDCKSINPVVFLENRHLSLRYAPVVEKILSEI
ncbi:ImmA/IrrE family metallo-endopeptidase [Ligilactobacillus ruminis]|uniref:ImmA/IrrE family metallo-endopeptidase n=1 Tax=Ligilactobacillus ruminis TaxID=1623 RepID=UPI002079A012|nr:ImmA/IrrE family metallo-endopeptidase [Ligilactobacillus ruminis]